MSTVRGLRCSVTRLSRTITLAGRGVEGGATAREVAGVEVADAALSYPVRREGGKPTAPSRLPMRDAPHKSRGPVPPVFRSPGRPARAVRAALVVALAGVPSLAATASAQPRPTLSMSREPSVWVSLTAALLQAETILDGRTNASWDFSDNTIQYRATLETVVAPGITVGAQGSWAPSVGTTVRSLGLTDRPGLAGCAVQCAATADLLGVAAFGRLGGGRGLHQVIEVTAGVQQLRDLRLDGGGTLAPERDSDLHASLAYGIGFGFSPRAQASLVQEFGIVSHQKDFLPRDRNGITQQRATRLTIRFGGGARR
jgi:hypothetical protein